jgi:hypothetical protein
MSIQASVHRIIAKMGNTSYSLSVVTSSGTDPNFPTKGPIKAYVSHPLRAFPGRYKYRQIDGELVRNNDIKLYVDTTDLTVVPSSKDQVTHTDGSTWNIKTVNRYDDADIVDLYILQLRA